MTILADARRNIVRGVSIHRLAAGWPLRRALVPRSGRWCWREPGPRRERSLPHQCCSRPSQLSSAHRHNDTSASRSPTGRATRALQPFGSSPIVPAARGTTQSAQAGGSSTASRASLMSELPLDTQYTSLQASSGQQGWICAGNAHSYSPVCRSACACTQFAPAWCPGTRQASTVTCSRNSTTDLAEGGPHGFRLRAGAGMFADRSRRRFDARPGIARATPAAITHALLASGALGVDPADAAAAIRPSPTTPAVRRTT